ncbi:MAG: N-6 DNA methylase [Mogibacterium sp.]|nr:N-6 DNA methylase [Mogibacterium sp.]
MKKKIQMKEDVLEMILSESISNIPSYASMDSEEDIDDGVKALLRPIFGIKAVKGKTTGVKAIDDLIPAWHGDKGHGKPDVMVFNFFGNKEINMIIENKDINSSEDPLPQAERYAQVGMSIGAPVRVIVGNHPKKKLSVKVLSDNAYHALKINGHTVHSIPGPEIIKLIYENPNANEFILEKLVEEPFTQKDFHRIINNLKTLYRQITELGNGDDISINFTVALVALKMIMEKQGKAWSSIKGTSDIMHELDMIIGRTADPDLKEKYADIFIIKDEKTQNTVFDCSSMVENIDVREKEEGRTTNSDTSNSVLMQIHSQLSEIPNDDLVGVDLFGEVYECLANRQTKRSMGEYFTRRHIINAIVKMLLSENLIEDIVRSEKKIADPACGTGGFLTESYKHICDYCARNYPAMDTTELASKIIVGYDINPNNIGRTRINMTLAGDGFSDIRRRDSLKASDLESDLDFILTNVPYGAGDYAISDASSIDPFIKGNKDKRLELNFVIRIIQLLRKGGKCAAILPEGLLEAPTLSDFRAFFLRNCKLNAIVSLPKFAFAPYTKWKTYVVLFEKRNQPFDDIEDVIRLNEKIWCYIVDNEGFANSDKRFPTNSINADGSWKHNELSEYIDTDGVLRSSELQVAWESKAEDIQCKYHNEWDEPIYGKKYGYISMLDIAANKSLEFPKIPFKEVKSKIISEANNNAILAEKSHKELISLCREGRSGYTVDKSDLCDDAGLSDKAAGILNDLQIQYDQDNDSFYDVSSEVVRYMLSLSPEKYFRNEVKEPMTLEELDSAIAGIHAKLGVLIPGGK